MITSPAVTAERITEIIKVLAYNDEGYTFLIDDKTLGIGFVCLPLTGADETTHQRITNFLNHEWPASTMIQFCLFSSDNINNAVNGYRALRMFQDDPLFNQMVDSRVEFLQRATLDPPDQASGTIVRNIYLVVTIKVPIAAPAPTDKELEHMRELQILSEKMLGTIGLNPVPLTADTYVSVMDDILHHGETPSWRDNFRRRADRDKPLNTQTLDLDKSIDFDVDGIWIGDQRVKTLGVKRLPDAAYPGFGLNYLGDFMSGARGLKCNFVISATLHFPEPQKTKSRLDTKRQITVSQAVGPLMKFLPVLQLKTHGFDVLNVALEEGDRPVQLYLALSVFGNDEEEAIANAANAKSYFSELQFQLIMDRYYCLTFFLNSIPFGQDHRAVKDLFRFKTMAARQSAVLLPLYGDWKGTGTPMMNFFSRNGQVMTVDLFDSGTNYNACIAAQSGAGKSFFTSYIITNYLSVGAKCWVIDVGRSYLNLCQTYGGDFIHFGPDSDICLNPFEIVKNYDEESDIIVGLVSAMAAPTNKLTDHQTANLKRVLSELWKEKGNAMIVDDIEQRLLASDDKRISDIGEQLFSFTTRGEYGKYFNGKNNVSFENRFSVLELDDLQGREHLQQVVLLQLIFQIQQDMYLGNRDRRKIVIIDEAWSLLSKGDVAEFIEHGYRRFRKYGGAAITVTQSIMDLYSNPTGRAIAENSANMYLLRQKGEAIDQLKELKRLPLSGGAYDLLKTVHTTAGAYSEIFFITEYGAGIGRLVVDPYQLLLYSTKAEDVQAIRDRTRAGMNIGEAITDILRERGYAA